MPFGKYTFGVLVLMLDGGPGEPSA